MSKDFKITLIIILLIGGLVLLKLIVLGPDNGKPFVVPDGPIVKRARPIAVAPQAPAPATSDPTGASESAPATTPEAPAAPAVPADAANP